MSWLAYTNAFNSHSFGFSGHALPDLYICQVVSFKCVYISHATLLIAVIYALMRSKIFRPT